MKNKRNEKQVSLQLLLLLFPVAISAKTKIILLIYIDH